MTTITMPTAITAAQPAPSAARSQVGGILSPTQSSQHSASAVHSIKLSRISGWSTRVAANGSASPEWNNREMPAATAAATTPLTT